MPSIGDLLNKLNQHYTKGSLIDCGGEGKYIGTKFTWKRFVDNAALFFNSIDIQILLLFPIQTQSLVLKVVHNLECLQLKYF